MLPLVEHCRARWAAWLVAGDGRLLAFAASEMRVRCLPQPLRRWCEGVRALPDLELLEEEEAAAAEPGPVAGQVEDAAPPAAPPPPGWHAAMPIMYNPLIRLPPDKGGGYLAEEYAGIGGGQHDPRPLRPAGGDPEPGAVGRPPRGLAEAGAGHPGRRHGGISLWQPAGQSHA